MQRLDAPRLRGPRAVAGALVALVCVAALSSASADEVAADAPTPLPIDEVLRRVRERSPSIGAARARSDAAVSATEQAARLANPSFELRGENLRPGAGGDYDAWDHIDLYVLVSQPLDLTGKRTARTNAARAAQDVAAAESAVAERDVVLRAARFYLSELRADALVSSLSSAREGLASIVDAMERRVRDGYAAQADLQKLSTELARITDQRALAEIEVTRGGAGLASLLGEAQPVAPARLVVPEIPPLPQGDPEDLVHEALARRPDVQAARARVTEARETVRLERARRLADPLVTTGYKRAGGEDTAVAGVVVALPIFDANSDAVARALSEERAASLELQALEEDVRNQASLVLRAARLLQERAAQSQTGLLEPAEGVRHAARSRFREGSTDVLALVDAERVYTETRREALDLRLQAYTSTLEARLALGLEIAP